MPDDSSGIYNVPAGTLVNTGDTVLPSQHNPWATDSAAAISNRYSKDGRAPLTGSMNVNGFSLQNLSSPVASGDATNKGYVDGQITAVNQNAEKISTKSANYTALLADKATSFRFTSAATLALTPAATLLNNWWCEVWATNGNVIIDPDSAETINGAATLILQTGQAAKVFCTGTAFFAWVFSDSRTGPQLQGYSFGLGLSTNATDAANDVDIAVGSAAADVSPYGLMQLNTALSKRIDATWAVGNNNGGLDTGAVAAAGTYYIWLIQRSDTLVTDALFSLSSTAPTMPANYDRKRLIGRVERASSTNGSPISLVKPGFVSTQQTYANNSAITVAHGLGAKPSKVRARLVCLTAEGGYSVGDEIHMQSWYAFTSQSLAVTLTASATSLTFTVLLQVTVSPKSGTGGTAISLTPANWRVILEADL